jgi:DNA invertase Pin-like site-specific DNA recombinase
VRCRYDEPGGVRKLASDERDHGILRLHDEDQPISAIARRFGISRRTVFRVLARSKSQRAS